MFEQILPEFQVSEAIRTWLKEDIPNFDVAAVALSSGKKEGVVTVKEQCVLAGSPFVEEIFRQLRCTVDWKVKEGEKITTVPCTIATVRGPVKQILQGERLALNVLGRACGIASHAKKLADIAVNRKWKGNIVGTRKTTPGFRLVEKYAMIVGGACPHRYDLSSMVMLKDNHIESLNSTDKEKAISQAITLTRKIAGHHLKIEVESRNEKEAIACALAGADVVLLDNFAAKAACSVAQRLKSRFPRVTVEASGDINEANISEYMGSGIDVLSSSKLSCGYSTIDNSMKLQDYVAEETTENDTLVKTGVKRATPSASGGKTVDSANVNKNGDSGVLEDVDVDVPEKRRKTDENSVGVEAASKQGPPAPSTPANKTTASSQSTTEIKSSPSVTVKSASTAAPKLIMSSATKQSISTASKAPAVSAKPSVQVSTNSSQSSGKQDNRPAAQNQKTDNKQETRTTTEKVDSKQDTRTSTGKVDTARTYGTNKTTSNTSKPSPVSSSTPVGRNTSIRSNQSSESGYKKDSFRSTDSSNQQSNRGSNFSQYGQSGQNRGQQRDNRSNQYNRNRGQDIERSSSYQTNTSGIQRPQPPQPVGRGIISSYGGGSGSVYQQQMALQSQVNRTTGVSLRTGSSQMGGRQEMGSRGMMNMGGSGRSGPNSMSNDGNRGYNSSRSMSNFDWQYGY